MGRVRFAKLDQAPLGFRLSCPNLLHSLFQELSPLALALQSPCYICDPLRRCGLVGAEFCGPVAD